MNIRNDKQTKTKHQTNNKFHLSVIFLWNSIITSQNFNNNNNKPIK